MLDPAKRDLWVREAPLIAITDPARLPFHYPQITFEEFIVKFGEWYSRDEPTATMVGIRAAESLHRWRAIVKKRKSRLEGKAFTTGREAQFSMSIPCMTGG